VYEWHTATRAIALQFSHTGRNRYIKSESAFRTLYYHEFPVIDQ
jgi:hypothetical protein